MSKNKNRRNREEEEDTFSDCSTISLPSQRNGTSGTSESDDESNELSGFLDGLTEKRATTREWAMKGISEIMRKEVSLDELEERCDDLCGQAMNALKKGMSKEALLAADLLALLFVSFPDECPKMMEEAESTLSYHAVHHKSAAVRGKVAELLALGAYISEKPERETASLMNSMLKLMTQGKIVKDFVVPALRAWGLLCTSLSDSFINNEGGERIIAWLKSLDALLECTEVDVRIAASENACILYESCWRNDPEAAKMLIQKLENAHYDDWNHGGKEVEEESDQSTDKTCTVHSFTSVRKIAKADRSKEKNVIRQATAVLERGEGPPTEKIKMKHTSIEVSTWREKTQLSFFRQILQGGFLPHMTENPLLREIFGVEEVPEDKHLTAGMQQMQVRAHKASSAAKVKGREKQIMRARKERSEQCDQLDLID
uniref:Interferon-related developmental regulator N-terminal domain-containing protein n=1 Tax=Hanusia phi TaxID=3032 RepID=A0A6T7RVE1_9CRYP|mmetsp:Transcript_31492/g.70857  ORF Transcript_31492/g.70857 Transcript_31492/m.70857 type:complete len:430 (+) Transcript_31492:131-1420(+)